MNTLKKRLISLAWHAGMMGLAAVIDAIAQNLTALQIDPMYVVVLGLILGQVSKSIHDYIIEQAEIKKLEQ